METKSEISIYQTWQPQFIELLEILQCFDSAPGTPNVAAALSLVFDITKQTESQKRLGHWLVQYIEPFLLNSIRDEQNLQEKTLAIAAYLFISATVDLDQKLPDEYLINYIEYASSQSWFEDHFLAFYCHFLKDQVAACEKISEFFRQNYERVLTRKHIPAISQSLIVLRGILTETEARRGYELLESLLNENSNFSHIAWGLWASSTNKEQPEKLITIAQNRINDAFWFVRRNSGISGLLVIASIGGRRSEIHDYLNNVDKSHTQRRIKITVEDNLFSVDMNSVTGSTTGNDVLSIFDLCLALIGFSKSKYDKLAYIIGLDDKNLRQVSERIKRISSQGGIDLSKAEKNVLNTLVIFTLALILCWTVFLQLGGGIKLELSKLSIYNWNIEEILLAVPLLDYLLGTIQSVRADGNAAKGLLRLPILRHWQVLRSRKKDIRK